jgi:hypothetical protein
VSELDELYTELEKADALGHKEDVTALIAMIDEVEAEQAAPRERQEMAEMFWPDAGDRNDAVQGGMNLNDMNTTEKALVGYGKGVENLWNGVQDAAYRVAGADDSLSALNHDIEIDKEVWGKTTAQSPWMGHMKTVGEIATALPVSLGVTGALSKFGAGAYTTAAAEGAIVEGLTTRGDLAERGKAAGWGAAFGVAGQGLVDIAGSTYNKYMRGKAVDVEGVAAKLRKPLTDAEALIADTKTKGGFNLDMADATGNSAALREKSDVMKLADEVNLRRFMAQQELDMTKKAQGFVNATGGKHADNISTGEDLNELLVKLRHQDEATYKRLYKQLDAETGGKALNTDGLEETLPKLLHDYKNSAKGTVNQLKGVLRKYGVLQNKGDEVFLLDATGKPIGNNLTPAAGAEKQVTAGNYEEMIQEINDLYKPMATKGENRVLGQTKAMLEEWVDTAMLKQGADPKLVNLGREARASRRAFKAKWEQGDAVEKMTTKRVGVDDYRMLPSQAVEHFTRPRNINDLKRLRGKLNLGKAADKQVWANMQQAPLLKALGEATKNVKDVAEGGVGQFNEQAFKRIWKKSLSPQAKEILYGKEMTKQVDDAVEAWSRRGRRAKMASDDNPSGTARAIVGVGARLTLPSGRSSGAGLAALPILRDIVQAFKKTRLVSAGEHLVSGRATPKHLKAVEKEINDKLMESYQGTDLLDYDKGIAVLARLLARELGEDQLLAERE